MADDIKLVVGVDYSQMTGLIKTTEQTKRALNLISKEFAKTNDQSAYMRGVMAIDKAQKKLDPSLRMTRSEIMKLGAAMRQEAKFEQALAAATNNLASAQTRGAAATNNFRNAQMAATKSSNRMGVVAQQAGYQVSDFVVQIQSGTNPLIAFSQQASQLVGVLPLVADQLKMSATRAIALSAGLGIAIPLISSAAMVFLNMRDSAEKAEKEVDEYKKTIDSLSSSVSKLTDVMELNHSSVDFAITKYGRLTKDVKEFLKVTKELAEYEVIEETGKAFEQLINTKEFIKVTGELSGIKEDIVSAREKLKEEIAGGQEEDILDNLRESIAESEAAYASLSATLDNMPEGKLMALSEEFLDASNSRNIQGMTDAIVGIRTVVNELPADVRLNMLKMVVQMEAQLRRLQGSAEKAADDIRNESFDFNLKLDVLTEDALFDLDAVLTEMRERDFEFDTELDILTQEALDDLDDALEEMRKKDLTLDIELRLLTEGAIADLQAVLDQQKQEEFLQGQDILSLGETAIADLAKALADRDKKAADAARKAAEKASRDPLVVLRKQINLEQALIGKTEARQRIIQALGVDFMKYGQDTIASLETQINKTIQLEEAEKKRQEAIEEAKRQQEELKDTIESSMEDAFMSVLDGTKTVEEAFRMMARDIIAHLMRVYVVQKMISSFTGGIPFLNANGNAFSNGNVIPYANGGVVGGPTYFPMSGGRTGLMGEAGPEAIMPLKRGKDGKLGVTVDGGQQQSVVIHQSFNFAANGDDSVKRIIASEAPKIAKMTEAQILDNRRRGGQFRKAFS